jgi:lactate racemase
VLRAGTPVIKLMRTMSLRYGHGQIPLEFDDRRHTVLQTSSEKAPLGDVRLGELLDRPIDSPAIEELIKPGESVLFVVPDATRRTAAGQIINLLIRRLIANGTAAHDIGIIFATGIHRKVTDEEKNEVLTPFISQRIKSYDHDPRDLMQMITRGETAGGIPIELNRRLFENDHVVLVGGITFHYFAGFTGSRKLICPGLASSRTIAATHKLAFDCKKYTRRDGVGTGLLDGNAVHHAFVEAASTAKPAFAVSTIVNGDGNAVDLYCGNWISSHRSACDAYMAEHTLKINERRDLVIVSCGGSPLDINMIQAHKALETASLACNKDGVIVLVAECADGLGRNDFLKWFEAGSSEDLAHVLCEKYQVNGQTAWSLRRKTELFRVLAVSTLAEGILKKMGIEKIPDLSMISKFESGYIIPNGARISIQVEND